MKIKVFTILFLLAAAGLFWVAKRTSPSAPHMPDPLRHECYVWQRVWNDDLRDSIRRAEPDLRGITVLAAEIDVRPGREKQQVMPVDYSFLSTLSVPVGVAIRINPYAGPFDQNAPAAKTIRQTIQTVLEKAEAAEFKPVELQIDYDCAESKLTGYRIWVQSLKQDFPGVPITITTLPCWLKHRQFKKLIQSCDGFVLQVHSLERPKNFDEQVILCDPKRSVKWIQQADRCGVPFRVALPTHGYLVAFDEQGRFTGLSAEGPMPGWPRETQIKTVLSDPKKIAAMIQEIRAISPKNLTGAIWFRLPVPSDQLNWQWHTLRCIIQGQTLTEKIEVTCEWPDSNLAEIYLVNSGEVDVSVPMPVALEFAGHCLAADGVNGYTIADNKEGRLLVRPTLTGPGWRIRSQEKIKIAWIRFSQETEVNAHVQPE